MPFLYALFFFSNGGILKRITLATFNLVYLYIMNIRVASAGPVFHQLCTIAPSITYFGGLIPRAVTVLDFLLPR